MRVLVVTVVHRPDDARIFVREIGALIASGHSVTYAAPFTESGVDRPSGVDTIDLPRANGRRRVAALRAARKILKQQAPAHDVVILHDPELLMAAQGLRHPVVVWDVHEDTAAALVLKSWLPRWTRRPFAGLIHTLETRAERKRRLILAEYAYAERFTAIHPVVPNTTPVAPFVPTAQPGRAVYIGHLTEARGALDLIEVGRLVHAAGITVDVVGHAHGNVRGALELAHAAGWIVWHGFVPNEVALLMLDGATAGLSLLHDEDNYQVSMPTKVIEYMAHGIPVITTPLPLAAQLVENNDCGVVVPFGEPQTAAAALVSLNADEPKRLLWGANGHKAALADWNWDHDSIAFVDQLATWVAEAKINVVGAVEPDPR
ncbi:MAG: glycosyltransferase family 4 protein [Actinobacteria bacterium]|nr:glycosyltransferase family 4 protein [Actinomycetota bacterium]